MWYKEGIAAVKKAGRLAKALTALIVCLAISMTGMAVSAAEYGMPDLDRIGSLSITFTVSGEPISSGNEVGIYKVADAIEDQGYKFVFKDAFAAAGEVPEDLDSVNRDLAVKLEKIAKDHNVPMYGSSKKLDAGGNVSFSDLEVGLYLIVHTKKTEITLSDKTKVVYTINPFLVSIPQRENGEYVYDVTSKPKVAPQKDVTPPKKNPPPPRLPQTGQLWWPVMVLAGLGVLMLCIGMIRKNRNK